MCNVVDSSEACFKSDSLLIHQLFCLSLILNMLYFPQHSKQKTSQDTKLARSGYKAKEMTNKTEFTILKIMKIIADGSTTTSDRNAAQNILLKFSSFILNIDGIFMFLQANSAIDTQREHKDQG